MLSFFLSVSAFSFMFFFFACFTLSTDILISMSVCVFGLGYGYGYQPKLFLVPDGVWRGLGGWTGFGPPFSGYGKYHRVGLGSL